MPSVLATNREEQKQAPGPGGVGASHGFGAACGRQEETVAWAKARRCWPSPGTSQDASRRAGASGPYDASGRDSRQEVLVAPGTAGAPVSYREGLPCGQPRRAYAQTEPQ